MIREVLEMINCDLVNSRLVLIVGYLEELQHLAGVSQKEFKSDSRNAAAAESFLRRSLEAAFDIGRHILAKTGNVDLASEYKSIARALGEKKIIELRIADALIQMAGYRNRLVDLYHQVTEDELYEIISHDLDDLESFVEGIRVYLGRLSD